MLVCCFFCWRNANLAGRFACRRCVAWFLFVFFLHGSASFYETKAFHNFFYLFNRFSHCQDRALERNRPQQREKNKSGHSAERLVGYYTPKRSHLKIAVLPQCEAFSADFAGSPSICALRRAKITEGERVVPPVVALHGRFLCTNLGRRSISKGNMATPQLKPCRG